MKVLDLVRLVNNNPYVDFNLTKDLHGIVVKVIENRCDVLFFNPKNVGDYAVVNIKKTDLKIEKEKLPIKFQYELLKNLDNIISKSNPTLKVMEIKEYDMVELLVEDEKYSKFGIHKGETGCVVNDEAVQNYIEVDFSGVDEQGNYFGDCISVKIEDLKRID